MFFESYYQRQDGQKDLTVAMLATKLSVSIIFKISSIAIIVKLIYDSYLGFHRKSSPFLC
jgi:hypothetical protein